MIRDNTWSAWYAETEGTMEPDILEFKKLLKKHGLSRVLDFGCGTGRHLVPLAKAGFEMYGFDQSKSAIARTAKKLEAEGLFSNLQIRNMKMRLPYEDNFFDAVLAIRVIMHARARAVTNMVKEIDRVLRIGGYVCLQVPSYEISKDWLKKCGATFLEPRTVISQANRPDVDVPHHYFTKKELLSLFKNYTVVIFHSGSRHYKGFCLLAQKTGKKGAPPVNADNAPQAPFSRKQPRPQAP